jgi:hypothetical protein
MRAAFVIIVMTGGFFMLIWGEKLGRVSTAHK